MLKKILDFFKERKRRVKKYKKGQSDDIYPMF